nr:unnamed protein product [Digitaria exilis]
MGKARGVVRVRRDALAARMTCPLCQGLLREATAITQCLHTCEFPVSAFLSSLPRSLVLPRRACLRSCPRRRRPCFPGPSPRGRSSARAAVSPRVCVLGFGFGVGFFPSSRSGAPGDRAGVGCEFFYPRRVVNAQLFSWIVALVPRPA